jgi:probable HAF family extracellular repeat protein
MEDIGTLGGSESFAYDINKKGAVIGISTFANDSGFHGFLYRNGHMRDLGEFNPTSINDRSVVVGGAPTPEGNRTFIFRAGKLHILHALAGIESYPTSINNCGEVVGETLVRPLLHAFVYTQGQLLDLNSVLPPSFASHVELTAASAINNLGQVTASGFDTELSEVRAFLLTPPAAGRCPSGHGNSNPFKKTCPCATTLH